MNIRLVFNVEMNSEVIKTSFVGGRGGGGGNVQAFIHYNMGEIKAGIVDLTKIL